MKGNILKQVICFYQKDYNDHTDSTLMLSRFPISTIMLLYYIPFLIALKDKFIFVVNGENNFKGAINNNGARKTLYL